ncbi:ABC transporter permease, partial [Lentzea sp. PSKA42]
MITAERVRGSAWLPFARRRAVRFLTSLWVLVTAAFLMIHLIPGDPVRETLGLTAPPEVVAARRAALGLDDPLPVQYWHYLTGLFRGEFGTSLVSGTPVADLIGDRLPATVQLAVLAFLVVIVVAVPVGVVMAVLTKGGRRRGGELAFTSTSVVLAAIPEFLLAVGLVSLFAVQLGLLPVAGNDAPGSWVLPVLALATG